MERANLMCISSELTINSYFVCLSVWRSHRMWSDVKWIKKQYRHRIATQLARVYTCARARCADVDECINLVRSTLCLLFTIIIREFSVAVPSTRLRMIRWIGRQRNTPFIRSEQRQLPQPNVIILILECSCINDSARRNAARSCTKPKWERTYERPIGRERIRMNR